MARFKRILLKLSGESLMGKQGFGIDPDRLSDYAKQIKVAHDMGVQIGIVIGGGNIFRGLSGEEIGIDRVTGDHMGMLATMINSLALQNAIEKLGLKQVSDDGALLAIIDAILAANQDKVTEYKSGKDKLFGFFVGQTMKESKGSANPNKVNDLLKQRLA